MQGCINSICGGGLKFQVSCSTLDLLMLDTGYPMLNAGSVTDRLMPES